MGGRCGGWWAAGAAGKASWEVNNLPPPHLWRNGVEFVAVFLVFSSLVQLTWCLAWSPWGGALYLSKFQGAARVWGDQDRGLFQHPTRPGPSWGVCRI